MAPASAVLTLVSAALSFKDWPFLKHWLSNNYLCACVLVIGRAKLFGGLVVAPKETIRMNQQNELDGLTKIDE